MSNTPQHRTAKRVRGTPTGKMPYRLEKRPAAPDSHKSPGCLVQVFVKDRTVPREGNVLFLLHAGCMLLVVFI